MSLALTLHWAGAIAWLGSSLSVAWLAPRSMSTGEASQQRSSAADLQKLMRTITMPGMALAGLGGAVRLYPAFWTTYATSPWFHLKLILLLTLVGLTAAIYLRLQAISEGKADTKVPGLLLYLVAAAAVAVLFLAAFQPSFG